MSSSSSLGFTIPSHSLWLVVSTPLCSKYMVRAKSVVVSGPSADQIVRVLLSTFSKGISFTLTWWVVPYAKFKLAQTCPAYGWNAFTFTDNTRSTKLLSSSIASKRPYISAPLLFQFTICFQWYVMKPISVIPWSMVSNQTFPASHDWARIEVMTKL